MPKGRKEREKWYERHGFIGNQEEYFRNIRGGYYAHLPDSDAPSTPSSPCPVQDRETV